jgi:phage tail-like protein
MISTISNIATGTPLVGYRFAAMFLAMGLANPVDIRFQKVSGLSMNVETHVLREGGENIQVHNLPDNIKYNNLTLERGLVVGSVLSIAFNETMSLFTFNPTDVLITLLNKDFVPSAAWVCSKAYPVKWSVSDFDANSNTIVIDTMELAYTQLRTTRI